MSCFTTAADNRGPCDLHVSGPLPLQKAVRRASEAAKAFHDGAPIDCCVEDVLLHEMSECNHVAQFCFHAQMARKYSQIASSLKNAIEALEMDLAPIIGEKNSSNWNRFGHCIDMGGALARESGRHLEKYLTLLESIRERECEGLSIPEAAAGAFLLSE